MADSAPLLPRCAGHSYPAEAEAALEFFQSFFGGDGGAPWNPNSNPHPLRGILAPHIDFRVSRRAYGHAYAEWIQRPAADTYLILGVGHHARRPWSVDPRAYETPFGHVETDTSLIDQLTHAVPFPLTDPIAHVGEHSIEFPVVLLQALRKLRGIDRPFQFIPLLCGGLFEDVAEGTPPGEGTPLDLLARALQPILAPAGKTLQIIVSIDGCHIGPRFDHPYPVNAARLRETAMWEETLWQQVEARNQPGFFRHLDGNARYFDGVGALALLMRAMPDFTLRRTAYEQWFEPRDASAVTFTSGVIE